MEKKIHTYYKQLIENNGQGESVRLKEKKRACRCNEEKSKRLGGGWGGRKAGLGNY